MIKRFVLLSLVSLTPIVSAVADNDPHVAAAGAMAQGQAAAAHADSALDEATKQSETAMADAKKQINDAMNRIDNAKAAGAAKKAAVPGDTKAAVNAGAAQLDAAAAAHAKH